MEIRTYTKIAVDMDEDDDIDQKVKVKKVRGGKIVQSVQTTFTKQEKRSEADGPGVPR